MPDTALIGTLLAAAPRLLVLATSRSPLRLGRARPSGSAAAAPAGQRPLELRGAGGERIARRLGYREVIAYCLGGMAELALLEHEHERAAKLLGASEELFRKIGAAMDAGEAETQQRILNQLYDSFRAERTDELRAAGAARSVDELAAAAG